jgi:SAM-dependent methyltransferase
VSSALYDRIGRRYLDVRREDPRIAARIHAALGEASSVLNVGAGAGAYEPRDREVLAVEPSATMRAQRPAGSAPVVDAAAEALPFADGSFDAAMAVFSDHHWSDWRRGLGELRRVARERVVLFNLDPAEAGRFWLTRDYLPGFHDLIPARYREPGRWRDELSELLGPVRLGPVAIPHDCRDGFYGAHWRRPHAYLDPRVRSGISVFALLDAREVEPAIDRLGRDLESGRWHEKNEELLELERLDLGYTLVIAERRPG